MALGMYEFVTDEGSSAEAAGEVHVIGWSDFGEEQDWKGEKLLDEDAVSGCRTSGEKWGVRENDVGRRSKPEKRSADGNEIGIETATGLTEIDVRLLEFSWPNIEVAEPTRNRNWW